MLEIREISVPGYKKVIEAKDRAVNLHGFIAIHDTTLGPALGGTRFYPYKQPEEALTDVLRLAKSMTYKSALAEDGLGGGKSVIMGNPHKDKTEKLLLSFAEAINTLKGDYIAAEDVGTCTEDMEILRKKTQFVVALPSEKSSGDPSRFTAWGVFRGIQAVAMKLWGSTSLKGKKVLIQGLGHVGSKLANMLFWEGAELILSDIDEKLMHDQALLYGAETVDYHDVYKQKCDIFAPCAMGSSINDETVKLLKCKAVAGAANNQLQREENGLMLMQKGILYAPDYLINSGGIINVATELEPNGYDPKIAREKIDHIYERLLALFELSEKQKKPPNQVANEIAEHNLKMKIGARKVPVKFK